MKQAHTITATNGTPFAVYSLINHITGNQIFGVLDSDGFDALGEGFDTPEEAQKVADELNAE